MNYPRYFFAALLALTLLLAACGGQKGLSNSKAFIGGTAGIVMSFMPGEPPAEVTSKDQPFSVTVKLQNKGEWAVPQGRAWLTLKGFDAVEFGSTDSALANQHPDADIDKNTINPDTGAVIPSTDVFKTFNLKYSGELSGNHEFPFVVDSCYEYGTIANAEVCVKKDLLDTADTSVCTVTGAKSAQNSGGPVQVANFQEFGSGKDAIRFSFDVKKVGTGDVSKTGSQCGTDSASKDVVHVKIDSGMPGLTCATLNGGTESDVKLVDSTKPIQCVQQLSGSDKTDKIKLANIELTYTYLDSVQTQVLVKQIS